jgi:16S rRNA (uracil1498-N3)-methyltransferase
MHRFHLPPGACNGPRLQLEGSEAHHALQVLRLKVGDPVEVLDGAGQRLQCRIESAGRHTVSLTVLERERAPEPPFGITLLPALTKGKAAETIIEKATELGAGRIVPLITERVVVRLEADEAAHKAAKWRLVAIGAMKQCGSPRLPRIEAAVPLREYLGREERFDLSLVASLHPGARHPREYLAAYQAENGHRPRSVSVWIGPEGDFTPAEVQAIEAAGARPITLGPNVLRADTAALYCLSVLNYELLAPQ